LFKILASKINKNLKGSVKYLFVINSKFKIVNIIFIREEFVEIPEIKSSNNENFIIPNEVKNNENFF